MDSGRWRQLRSILAGARALQGEERERYLDEQCSGDPGLRREAAELLDPAAFGRALEAHERGREARAPQDAPRSGAYEVEREIGAGGMGTVYLARRAGSEFAQQVALKVIKRGMDTDDVLRRFRSERAVLARLQHDHIARLFDGGATEDGLPYLAMEYVDGQPIDTWCDARGLGLRPRIELFLSVCDAVQYAHRNLVVHRDIKPSNILVTSDGSPKLLDFGIAKVLAPDGEEPGARTLTGQQLMTPDYASPEQLAGEPETTASDVYSLGIVLYELFTGRKLFTAHSPNTPLARQASARPEPTKPSVAALRNARALQTHGAEPQKLARELRSDLDAIVLKAMRDEPAKRYGSVERFAEDIRRHLAGLPVEARRGTVSYRAAKFVRRNRVGLAAAALVVLALLAGLVATLREADRARAAEVKAQRRFDDVRRLANSFLFEFDDAIKDLPGATPARALVVRRALEYLDDLSREAAGDRALARELAEAYQKVGDVQGNAFMPNLGDVAGAIDSYGKAIGLLEPVVAGGTATDEEQATFANALLIGGGIRLVSGDAPAAVAMSQRGLTLREGLAARDPGNPRRQLELARAWQYHAFNLYAAGDAARSARALEVQARILRTRLAAEPADREAQRSLGQNRYLAGHQLDGIGRADEALAALEEAARVQEELLRSNPTSAQLQRDFMYLRTEIGAHALLAGDARRSLEEYEQALVLARAMAAADPASADQRLSVAMSLHNTGTALVELDELPAALARYAEAKRIYEANFSPGGSNAWAAGMLGALYLRSAEALRAAQARSVAVEEEVARSLGSPCELYRLAVGILESLGRASELDARRRDDLALARERLAACP